MHKDYHYESVFAKDLNNFISAQREAGFSYDNPAYWLFRFDQYCVKNSVKDPVLTQELYEDWSTKQETETKTTQSNRVQALRKFSEYLITQRILSYLPLSVPKPEKTIPYLMSDSDITEFFTQVDSYEPRGISPVRFERISREYSVLFRLIYCCGLRNNEACSLRSADTDLDKGFITIRQSKGRKDRLVYLSKDLQELCIDYYRWLCLQLGSAPEWFFPGQNPEIHIPKTSVDGKFNCFWQKTTASGRCDKKPTVHGLRHAFVIRRMNIWMEQDLPLQAMMPYLSSYLGHQGPIETYYYFHLVEDVFTTVRRKDQISSRVIPEVRS